uniref:Kazal-like domain-containing protein n=1 Tax=Macrostomum lignano TaxID=282301 RepID=A0A1I8G8I9_9PLAT
MLYVSSSLTAALLFGLFLNVAAQCNRAQCDYTKTCDKGYGMENCTNATGNFENLCFFGMHCSAFVETVLISNNVTATVTASASTSVTTQNPSTTPVTVGKGSARSAGQPAFAAAAAVLAVIFAFSTSTGNQAGSIGGFVL